MNEAASTHQAAAPTAMPALGDCQIGEGEIRLFLEPWSPLWYTKPAVYHQDKNVICNIKYPSSTCLLWWALRGGYIAICHWARRKSILGHYRNY